MGEPTVGRSFVRVSRWPRPGLDPAHGLSWADRFGIGVPEVGTIVRRIWPFPLVGA